MATPLNSEMKLYIRTAGGLALVVAASAIIALAVDRPAPPERAKDPAANPVTNFPVYVRQPHGPPRISTGESNFHGQAVTISCSTCHASTTPNIKARTAEDLDEFHQGLSYKHGQISCLSCHNAEDYDALRLADGTALPFENVQQLCGQCHGPQMRDYRNGSHGGMNGYWDLSRGPRTRNNCTDCHDPHAPQFQAVMPVFEPVPASKKATAKH